MEPATRDWRALAARQLGIITSAQLNECGVDKDCIYRKLQSQELERVLPAVYRVAGSARTRDQMVRAVYEWGCPGAVMFGRTAASLLGLDVDPGRQIEVAVSRRLRAPAPDVVVVQRRFEPCDVSDVSGMQVTTMPRTVIDLAASLTEQQLDLALDSAIRKRMPRDRFVDRLGDLSVRGRKGIRLLNKLVAERKCEQGLVESAFERRLLRSLRSARLSQPVCQFEFVDRDGYYARLDFAYPELGIAIEADGYRWHSGRAAWERDRKRVSELASRGWRVLQVTWLQLKYEPTGVTERVRRALSTPAFVALRSR